MALRDPPRGSASWGKAEVADVANIDFAPWNPNQMDAETFRKERNSIAKFGFVVPVIVRRQGDRFQIIDGEHRLKAAIELGMTEVPIFDIGPIGDHEAQQLTVVLNELHGNPEPDKLGALLRNLLAKDTLDELVEVMPFSKDQYTKAAKLPDFDWDGFQQKVHQGSAERWKERILRLPPHAAEIFDRAMELAKHRLPGDPKDWEAAEAISAAFLGEP